MSMETFDAPDGYSRANADAWAAGYEQAMMDAREWLKSKGPAVTRERLLEDLEGLR
jgi:hypothetical protein